MHRCPPDDDALSSLAAAAIIGINLDWSSGLQRKSCYHGGQIMKTQMTLAAAALLLGTAVSPSLAEEKIKLGVIVTLSGPAAALGQQVRDGFALGVKDLGGKMGGREAEAVVVEDELEPPAAGPKGT